MLVSKSTTKITCHECQKEFSIPTKEVTRQRKNGREYFFCSRSCSTVFGNRDRVFIPPPPQYGNQYGKKGNFTYYLCKCKDRSKEFNLTEEYLSSLWKAQNGKCAITGIDLVLQKWNTKKKPNSASIDRIDSNLGYIKGNVQFLAYSVNMAKNDFDDVAIREFFEEIHRSTPIYLSDGY